MAPDIYARYCIGKWLTFKTQPPRFDKDEQATAKLSKYPHYAPRFLSIYSCDFYHFYSCESAMSSITLMPNQMVLILATL